MTTPKWITPPGFIGTATERTESIFPLQVVDTTSTTFSILSGTLPPGLTLSSTGTVSGIAFSVSLLTSSKFAVRARNTYGISDRSFVIDTIGPTEPNWITASGYLNIGPNSQLYAINTQYIEFKFEAISDVVPLGQNLRYYIGDNDGQLPPGLRLAENGVVSGIVNDTDILDIVSLLTKTYQFYVTVTDNVSVSRRLFKINVVQPNSLRSDSGTITADTNFYTSDVSYNIPLQWITPADLGGIRSNNRQIIELLTYDSTPITGPVSYELNNINNDNTPSTLPYGFKLDTQSGTLYATLMYQPAYSIPYKFTINAVKTNSVTNQKTLSSRTFNLIVVGDDKNEITFITPKYLGTINPGVKSELAVVAINSLATSEINYQLHSGRLPAGLTLNIDGTISGSPLYNSQTTIDHGLFTLDSGLTTIDAIYTFSIIASDINTSGQTVSEFQLSVVKYNDILYTEVWVEPRLTDAERSIYMSFITNEQIFDHALIYRINDLNFGIQPKLKLFLEFGLQQSQANDYFDCMRNYFYNKQFLFGEIVVIPGISDAGVHLYDAVCVTIVDPISDIHGPVINNLVTVFPNSISNMRSQLESIILHGNTIESTNRLNPMYMRNSFKSVSVLCYATPGSGSIIASRINFNFSTINFEVDRLLIGNTVLNTGEQFIMFPKTTIQGSNNGEINSLLVDDSGELLLFDSETIILLDT